MNAGHRFSPRASGAGRFVTPPVPDTARLPRIGRSGTSLREGDGGNMGADDRAGISFLC